MILSKKISKYTEDTYMDYCKYIYNYFHKYIVNNKELIPLFNQNKLRIEFFTFLICPKYVSKYYNYDEYISLKFNSDMVDLFLEMKDISERFTVDLLIHKTSEDLLYFILSNFIIDEEYESDKENNINELLIYDNEFIY